MPTYISGNSTNFTPAPEGTHQAVCVDIIDNGMIETQWGKKHKVTIRWQVNEKMEDGKPFIVQKRYTASLNEKAVLRHELEAWRGRAFTFDELAQFDLDTVIGANCLLAIVHKKGDKGGTFANIQSIAPLIKGMKRLEPIAYVKQADRAPEPKADNGHSEPPPPDDMDERPMVDDDIPF